MTKFDEIGTIGIQQYMGFIQEAYTTELQWPSCYPLYNRIRRSDPEITIVRAGYQALGRNVEIEVVGPETPTDDDKRAGEFYESELENVDGGIVQWLDALVTYTPFMGWAWWQVVPGVRLLKWRPPDDDPWRSQADDGLLGVRRLAWRDHSSFEKWEVDDFGRLRGMWQNNINAPQVMIPLENSLHVTFGDVANPEGLTPLEAIWRLERIKYGLEVVFGIGSEHTAGYLQVIVKRTPDASDKQLIQAAARAILTAQEGNFATWIEDKGVGEVKDTPFSAAGTLLEAIRYYGLLKLQLYNMQWVSIASTANTGSYSAMQDASSMFMTGWNSMCGGFISQYDSQVGRRLWDWNKDKFPGATSRPIYKHKPTPKTFSLQELGAFWSAIQNTMPFGDDDYLAMRKRSGFLPEILPEVVETPTPKIADETAPIAGVEDDAGQMVDDVETGDTTETTTTGGDELKQLTAELKRANDLLLGADDQPRDESGKWTSGGGGGGSGDSGGGGGGGFDDNKEYSSTGGQKATGKELNKFHKAVKTIEKEYGAATSASEMLRAAIREGFTHPNAVRVYSVYREHKSSNTKVRQDG